MFRIVITGKSIKELAENAQAFINEAFGEKTKIEHDGQDFDPNQLILKEQPTELSTAPTPVVVPPPILVPPTPAASLSTGLKDKRGVPWDERIHSSSQQINKDGSWRTRRGVEPATVKELENQLLTTGSPAVAPPVPNFAPPPAQEVASLSQPPQQQDQYPNHPSAPVLVQPATVIPFGPPPTLVVPSQPVTLSHTIETFKAQFPLVLAELVKQGKLDQNYINSLKNYFKVSEIWDVNEEQKTELFIGFVEAKLITRIG